VAIGESVSLRPNPRDVDLASDSSVSAFFTPDSELELLYDPRFIVQSFRDSIGTQYHVRGFYSVSFRSELISRCDPLHRLTSYARTSRF
jgi:hypothetical protein